jgi:hypothetical protein
MNNIYIRFLHIYLAICVPSLVEIAPGVPELCSDIHTYIHFYTYVYIDLFIPPPPQNPVRRMADLPPLVGVRTR